MQRYQFQSCQIKERLGDFYSRIEHVNCDYCDLMYETTLWTHTLPLHHKSLISPLLPHITSSFAFLSSTLCHHLSSPGLLLQMTRPANTSNQILSFYFTYQQQNIPAAASFRVDDSQQSLLGGLIRPVASSSASNFYPNTKKNNQVHEDN